MASYEYQASDLEGKIVDGVMDARSQAQVVERLRQLGLFPIRVREEVEGGPRPISTRIVDFLGGLKKRDIFPFTVQMATMLDAGVPLDRCLSVVTELTQDKGLKEILKSIKSDVQAGKSLGEAFSAHPKVFSDLYRSMIAAGEFGGFLEVAFKRLAEYLEEQDKLKGQVKSAMIYPALMSIVGGAAVVILLTFVIPRFAGIFEDLGQALPLSTRALLNFSDFITVYWWAIAGLFVLSAAGINAYLRTDTGSLLFDRFKINAPLLGELNRKIAVARFARTLGTLIRCGVPILEALDVAKDTMRNRYYSEAIQDIHDSLKEGESIAEPLRETGLFPLLSIHMIAVGEETGDVDEMLLKVADTYEKDTTKTLRELVALLEPAMILIFGVLVGFVVVALLMAITSLSSLPF
ncbi:MAG: type II secretion system F family protein [Candidatus Glassbacteria bacterium]